ncbi:hypothetical protein GEMRC1_007002 [Eukaryota sp. GEM-RC1]
MHKLLCTTILIILIQSTIATRDCDLCKRGVNGLVPPVVRNKFFAEFFMKMACDRILQLSLTERTQCKQYVHKNLDHLMTWIKERQAADNICKFVRKCETTHSEEFEISKKILPKIIEFVPVVAQNPEFNRFVKHFCKDHAKDLELDRARCKDFVFKMRDHVLKMDDIEGFASSLLNGF